MSDVVEVIDEWCCRGVHFIKQPKNKNAVFDKLIKNDCGLLSM